MRETKKLIMNTVPDVYDAFKGIVYDGVKFLDENNNEYWYVSKSCTINGSSIKRTKFLLWAWSHKIGDKITITAEFKDGKIYRPTIK